MKPLSHHEILGWIEPFARRGLQADLAASDRLAGKLSFRPQAHRLAVGGAPTGPGPGADATDVAGQRNFDNVVTKHRQQMRE